MHFLFKPFRNHYAFTLKLVMESNSFKPNSHHIKTRHLANNSEHTCASMNTDGNSKKHTSGVKENCHPDKENLNPNRKSHINQGSPEVMISYEMINHNSNHEPSGHVKTDKKLHSNEETVKARQSLNSAVHNQHSTHAKTIAPQCYIDAINQLNTLQSNAKALKDSRIKRDPAETKAVQVDQVLHYLGHLNVTEDDIRKLHFIHISGTKGKGSTSAYCESILRSHGFTTGFFSSPHLIEVRERIKLNGKPVSYEKFTKYFWTVYNALHAKRRNPDDMPAYFKFLTVMSFYIFVKEKPDVCIMEVGIGGLYDNTNIIPNTDVVGITSLGLDHTAVLGNTLEEIAAQKAGILKKGCLAVTAQEQKYECKQVLLDKAEALGCTLFEAPNMFHYDWKNQSTEDWGSTVQSINISLAIQLAYLFMFRMNKEGEFQKLIDKVLAILKAQKWYEENYPEDYNENPFPKYKRPPFLPQGPFFKIDPKTYRGIIECEWPGRVQLIRRNNVKYFLDGAHTNESIKLCAEWFGWKSVEEAHIAANKTPLSELSEQIQRVTEGMEALDAFERQTADDEEEDPVIRILVFNVTGDRDPAMLLPPLLKRNKFDYILVTPIVVSNVTLPDLQYGGNRTVDRYGNKKLRDGPQHHKDVLHHLKLPSNLNLSKADQEILDALRSRTAQSSVNTPDLTNKMTSHAEKIRNVKKIVKIASTTMNSYDHTVVVECNSVLDAYNFRHSLDPSQETHVLVTGSLHLVGAFLNVLNNHE